MKGIVKFFNSQKSFGFIIPKDRARDVFFHATQVASGTTLRTDDVVAFEAEYDRQGRSRANNVGLADAYAKGTAR